MKDGKGTRHLSLLKEREKVVVEDHSLSHWVTCQSALCPFLPPPLPLGTNAPSANVTVASHEACIGVVVMKQLNCRASLGSFGGSWGEPLEKTRNWPMSSLSFKVLLPANSGNNVSEVRILVCVVFLTPF